MTEGDTDYTYLYITVGDKAARVKVQAIVKQLEATETETVGQKTISVKSPVDDNYATKSFTLDRKRLQQLLVAKRRISLNSMLTIKQEFLTIPIHSQIKRTKVTS